MTLLALPFKISNISSAEMERIVESFGDFGVTIDDT